MTPFPYIKALVVSAAVLSLAGCMGGTNGGASSSTPATGGSGAGAGTGGGASSGGGTGGGATGGGTGGGGAAMTSSAYTTKLLEYTFLSPTQTPVSGSASYTGKVQVLTLANQADPTESIFGDVNMAVDFAPGAVKPVSGTVGNFAGQVGGVDVVVAGTLSTANAAQNDPNFVSAQFNQPTGVTLTSVTGTFAGDLTDPQSALSGSATMIISGNLKEAGGQKLAGGNSVSINSPNAPFIATSGGFYADKN
jgi:hypothetical protein